MENAVQVARIDPGAAAVLLAGVERRDPRGVMTAADLAGICHRGLCFIASVGDAAGQVAYVLNIKNGVAWIDAAQGAAGLDLTRAVLPHIEQQCAQLDSIGFTTARRGLVHKAQAQGYEVAGWIMKKRLKP